MAADVDGFPDFSAFRKRANVDRDVDIGTLFKLSGSFAREIQAVKEAIHPRDFDWYPYSTLSTLERLDRLLTGSNRQVLRLIGDKPLLDLGSGDGDLSLFFWALGCKVAAMDFNVPNHNGMKGIRALTAHFNANIPIGDVDFDSQFSLEAFDCGLVLLLGVLYHLKNPHYLLETLSKHAKFCLLSTKVASLLPDAKTSMAEWPVAYLVGKDELNQDDSNFWIFSEAGLKRLLDRTHWKILDYWKPRGPATSPDSIGADERVYCLVQSTYGMVEVVLRDGWHEPEMAGWRWTSRRFSIEVPRSPGVLTMEVFVPAECLRGKDAIRMQAASQGVPLFAESFTREGKHTLARRVIFEKDAASHTVRIDFELDSALPPDNDLRERGLIVSRVHLE